MTDRAVPQDGEALTSAILRWLSWAAIAATTVITLPRLTTMENGDFFTFVSVAERLRSGDRLYADVWDNKDPYFYYALSLMGDLGGAGYYLLELLWVGVAVFALAQLGRNQGMSRQWSLVVAWGISPWPLIGYAYRGTMTAMPGIALVFVVLALASRRRWAWVGVVLGLLLFLKLILVPVAVVGAAVFCGPAKTKATLAVLGGLIGSSLVGVAVLAARGELGPYVSMLDRNSEYAGRMVDSGGVAGFVQHLSSAFPVGEGYPGGLVGACAVGVGLALVLGRMRSGDSLLALCTLAVAVSSMGVLGLTAVWTHHGQLLALPACLTLLTLAQGGPPRGAIRYAAVIGAGVLAGWLMGGATPLPQLLIRPGTAAQPYQELRGPSPEAQSIADDDVTSYARLGRNDLDAHARGLGSLALTCPDFQQYPFDPDSTFTRTLRCLPGSDVVFVFNNFAGADTSDSPSYVRFTAEAEAILRARFVCTATDYGRKCLRVDR